MDSYRGSGQYSPKGVLEGPSLERLTLEDHQTNYNREYDDISKKFADRQAKVLVFHQTSLAYAKKAIKGICKHLKRYYDSKKSLEGRVADIKEELKVSKDRIKRVGTLRKIIFSVYYFFAQFSLRNELRNKTAQLAHMEEQIRFKLEDVDELVDEVKGIGASFEEEELRLNVAKYHEKDALKRPNQRMDEEKNEVVLKAPPVIVQQTNQTDQRVQEEVIGVEDDDFMMFDFDEMELNEVDKVRPSREPVVTEAPKRHRSVVQAGNIPVVDKWVGCEA